MVLFLWKLNNFIYEQISNFYQIQEIYIKFLNVWSP